MRPIRGWAARRFDFGTKCYPTRLYVPSAWIWKTPSPPYRSSPFFWKTIRKPSTDRAAGMFVRAMFLRTSARVALPSSHAFVIASTTTCVAA